MGTGDQPSASAQKTPAMHALLIGIDRYLPNRLLAGGTYPNLRGCVADIRRVEELLLQKVGLPADRITKLTATNGPGTAPSEPPAQWPTYENMVRAIQDLTTRAAPGEQVYIHYSGHGGQAKSAYPGLKSTGLDETLVPTDIGNEEARYLRDVELAHLLKAMTDKGLVVTLVLDSCHSGGATRGTTTPGQGMVRGIAEVDQGQRRIDSDVADTATLVATWNGLNPGGARGVSTPSGWLPSQKGYVFLAACRPSELANELPFDGQESNGALTYWLLDALRQLGPGLTYKTLYDRIVAKVHSQFSQQTPLLEGDDSRVVFGVSHVAPAYAVNVTQVNEAGKTVVINTGVSQLIRVSARFAIYPPGTTDFTALDRRQAIIEVTAPKDATSSTATIVTRHGVDPIEQGAQAVLLDVGSVKLGRTVGFTAASTLPPGLDPAAARAAIEAALTASGHGFVRAVAPGETADYTVSLDADGAYRILDTGGVAFATIRPAIPAADTDAPARVVARLEHLSRYHAILQLDNHDSASPLARRLIVEVLRAQEGYQPGDHPAPRPLDVSAHGRALQVGDYGFLHIKNASSRDLNVAALDLDADWSILQFPLDDTPAEFRVFAPGEEAFLPFKLEMPADRAEGLEVFKVIATVGNVSFRWLLLPSLDQPRTASRPRGTDNDLDALLAGMSGDQVSTRAFSPVSSPSRDWAVAQVEVRVVHDLAAEPVPSRIETALPTPPVPPPPGPSDGEPPLPGTPTGRLLVLLPEGDPEPALRALGDAGLQLTRGSSGADAVASALREGDGVYFESLGVAVITEAPATRGAVRAASLTAGMRTEPERFNGICADGPSSLADYLRGYRDAVSALTARLLEGGLSADAGPWGAPSFRNESEVTWGVQATSASRSGFTGRGVKIAILDTGIDLAHPDFAGRSITHQSFVPGEPVQDGHGHGTHTAGTACGPMAPSVLPRYGVAPGAELFIGKVLSNTGSGTDSAILAGIDWALRNGCRVISMSLGGPSAEPSGVYHAVGLRALAKNAILVAAAGNDSHRDAGVIAPTGRPASSGSIFAVAAVDDALQMANFSNGGKIEASGPGVSVYSSSPLPVAHRHLSGTSMATPHVAGVAALLMEAFPEERAGAIWNRLKDTARPLFVPMSDGGSGLVQAPMGTPGAVASVPVATAPAGEGARAAVTVLVADDRAGTIATIAAALQAAGMVVGAVNAGEGTIVGTVAADKRAALEAVDGVTAVM